MYTLKRGVTIFMSPEIEKMLAVVSLVYKAFYLPVVVTSGLDGPHREGSLHYKLRAFDLRKVFPMQEDKVIWNMHREYILDALESKYQELKLPVLIVEEEDHLHIEWVAE